MAGVKMGMSSGSAPIALKVFSLLRRRIEVRSKYTRQTLRLGDGDLPVRAEVYASEEAIEIFVEADFETLAEERRRFAIINIPRHLFSEATGPAARRATRTDR